MTTMTKQRARSCRQHDKVDVGEAWAAQEQGAMGAYAKGAENGRFANELYDEVRISASATR